MKLLAARLKHIRISPTLLTLFCVSVLVIVSTLQLNYALRTHLYFSQDDFMSIACFSNNSYLNVLSQFVRSGDLIVPKRMIGNLLGYLNFKVLLDLFSVNPLPFIINDHLFHLANILLIFYLSFKSTKNRWASLLIAIIFNKYYLFYFSNMHEYLVTFFSLITFILFINFPRYLYLSLITFILTLLSKQYALVVPLFLLYYSFYFHKKLLKNNFPFLVVALIYLLLQLVYYLKTAHVWVNPTYETSLNLALILKNLNFYINPSLLLILSLFPLFSRKYHSWWLALIFILSLFPALVLVNRRDLYYFYYPAMYLLLYVAVNLPKSIMKQLPVFLLVIILFGGRQAFPIIARQDYPNWELVSINNLLFTIREELQSKPQVATIETKKLNLYRDARSVLEYNNLPIFIGPPLNQEYTFSYNSQTSTLSCVKK